MAESRGRIWHPSYFHFSGAKMSKAVTSLHNKKRRRIVLASVGLLAVLAAGGIVFGVIGHVRESYDRVH